MLVRLCAEKITKLEILLLALGTGIDDTNLKSFALNHTDIFLKLGKDISTECEKIYTMTDIQKYVLLRSLLVGNGGVLESQTSRRALLDQLAKDHILHPDGGIESEILKIFRTLLDEGKMEDVYFIFSSILKNRIFRRPNTQISLQELLRQDPSIEDFIRSLMRDFGMKFSEDDLRRDAAFSFTVAGRPFSEVLSKNPEYQEWYNDYMCIGYVGDSMPKEIRLFVSKLNAAGVALPGGEYAHSPKEIQKKESNLDGVYKDMEKLCGGFEYAGYEGKMDATTLVVNIARQLGSIGIRFLQVMGQYVDIPEELRTSFSDVYDNIHGQLKIVAHETLSNSWPEFTNNIQELGECIGG